MKALLQILIFFGALVPVLEFANGADVGGQAEKTNQPQPIAIVPPQTSAINLVGRGIGDGTGESAGGIDHTGTVAKSVISNQPLIQGITTSPGGPTVSEPVKGTEDVRPAEVLTHERSDAKAIQSARPVNSEEMGFQTLGEYRNAMPEIANELNAALQHAQGFRQLLRDVIQEKKAEVAKLREIERLAASRSRNLESVPDEGGASNPSPLLPQQGRSQIPAENAGEASIPALAQRAGSFGQTGAVERGLALDSVATNQRQKLKRPTIFVPETNAAAGSKSETDAVAKDFAGMGKLELHSSISVAETKEMTGAEFSAEKTAPGDTRAGKQGRLSEKLSAREKGKLREALLKSRARVPSADGERDPESAAQSALRGALESAENAGQSASGGRGGLASGQSSLALDSSMPKSSAFSMPASENDAAVRAFTQGLASEQSAEGVLGAESNDLFERVHAAHRRSEKVWQQRQLQANL